MVEYSQQVSEELRVRSDRYIYWSALPKNRLKGTYRSHWDHSRQILYRELVYLVPAVGVPFLDHRPSIARHFRRIHLQ
jgi:hypothetical protein